jgi:hypothetical protein
MDCTTFFLDKAVDLLVTILGVGLGAYLALLGIKYQMSEQAKKEKKRNDEITATIIDRCRLELRDNKLALENKLLPILDPTIEPNKLHYEWMLTITESFQHTAYDELLRLNLSHNMPKRIDNSLAASYKMLDGLHYMAKIAQAGWGYQNIYGGDPDFRRLDYKNILNYTPTVYKRLKSALDEITQYTKKGS